MLTVLRVQKYNRTYTLVREAQGWYISGHPEYCPEPTPCIIHGSTWGGSMIKPEYIGRGMHLEVGLPKGYRLLTTEIQDVTEVQ
jgi:hypothetical protein